MTIASGHRFEATQALRQVLARAISWGLIDVNPAKQGVDNPQRRRTEKRPFQSWAELVRSPPNSDPATGRSCSSLPRPGCGHAANAVLQVDPVVNDVVATFDLPRVESFAGEIKIAFARGHVWVKSRPSGLLTRIDPQTHV